ncbi:MAG: hypothetical protein IPG07_18190 [Crocinitomicaceae bacterium]|nr:hypothetical protein [Crocinitomicaceae bacterium]
MKKLVVLLVVILYHFNAITQDITQTVRGTVADIESNFPLSGARVKITISQKKQLARFAMKMEALC